jgi:lysophospholipase L1-like esterase
MPTTALPSLPRLPLHLVAAAPLMPLLAVQGRGVRRRMPLLPPAAGQATGHVDGSGPTVRLVVLGESTVAGIGAATHAEGLTGHLAVALARSSGRTIAWQAVGKVGVTARQATALVPRLSDAPTDLVVVVLGINDVLAFTPPARWAEHLLNLITQVREHLAQPVPILIAGVPPAGQLPALPQPLRGVLGRHARALDAATHRLAQRLPGVRHAVTEARVSEHDVCTDRFHPSPTGYAAWAQQLALPAAALTSAPDADHAAGR